MSNSSLVNVTVKADSSNYSGASYRKTIDHITVHHMAGVLTAQQCGNVFAKKGRNGSAHYGIGSDGKIGLYVDEANVAWADGNWASNQSGVSIETSNSSTGGDWPVADSTYQLLIALVADIAKRNNLGTLVVGKNLFGHRDKSATTCPGNYLYSRLSDIATQANNINLATPTTTTTTKASKTTTVKKDSFLPTKGYWGYGDTDAKVGQIASFMYKTFPSYTKRAALGNYFGKNLKSSIVTFQKRTGLEADGNVGPITLAKLRTYGFKG